MTRSERTTISADSIGLSRLSTLKFTHLAPQKNKCLTQQCVTAVQGHLRSLIMKSVMKLCAISVSDYGKLTLSRNVPATRRL